MNSHKPQFEDDLDRLLRSTLENKINSQTPPNRVWRKIKEDLRGPKPKTTHLFSSRASLVVQVALLMILFTLGGVESPLQRSLKPFPGATSIVQSRYVPSSHIAARVKEEPVIVESSSGPVDDREARLLDAQLRPRPEFNQNQFEQAPVKISRSDVAPHINSPEGRVIVYQARYSSGNYEAIVFLGGRQFGSGVIQ